MATKEEKGLQEALIAIQKKLKAPKDLYNKFGNYKYRSAESILEAVKPLLAENGVLLTITDEIVMIGTRYYVKSIAMAQKGGETMCGIGYAREDDSKKGMDGSQVTGASSSYARKYALNGLFLIDDTKDADTDEYLQITGDILAGDIITVTTKTGNKTVTLDRGGVKTNIINRLVSGSTWLTLREGRNRFYLRGTGLQNLKVTIVHTNAYLGV